MNLVQRRARHLLLLVLLGGIAGGVAYWQRTQSEATAKQQAENKQVLGAFEVKDVRSITFEQGSQRFTVQRHGPAESDAAWKLTHPTETLAEASTVQGVLEALRDLEQKKEVGSPAPDSDAIIPPADRSIFGLEPARFSVSITLNSGETRTLKVGKRNRFDGSIYATTTSSKDAETAQNSRVSLVSGEIEYQVDKDLLQLREKRLVLFQEDEVAELKVTLGPKKRAYVIKQTADSLTVATGGATATPMAADRTQVTGILNALKHMRAIAVAAEAGGSARAYRPAFGLDKPKAVITMTFKPGSKDPAALAPSSGEEAAGEAMGKAATTRSPIKLILGQVDQGGEERHYVTAEGNYPVLELSSDWVLRKVAVTIVQLRDLRVLPFETSAIDQVTLAIAGPKPEQEEQAEPCAGQDIALTRTTKKDATPVRWSIQQGTCAPPKTAKASVVAGLLYRLSTLKAQSVVQESPTEADLAAKGFSEKKTIKKIILKTKDNDSPLGEIRFSTETHSAGTFVNATPTDRLDLIASDFMDSLSWQPQDYEDSERTTN